MLFLHSKIIIFLLLLQSHQIIAAGASFFSLHFRINFLLIYRYQLEWIKFDESKLYTEKVSALKDDPLYLQWFILDFHYSSLIIDRI